MAQVFIDDATIQGFLKGRIDSNKINAEQMSEGMQEFHNSGSLKELGKNVAEEFYYGIQGHRELGQFFTHWQSGHFYDTKEAFTVKVESANQLKKKIEAVKNKANLKDSDTVMIKTNIYIYMNKELLGRESLCYGEATINGKVFEGEDYILEDLLELYTHGFEKSKHIVSGKHGRDYKDRRVGRTSWPSDSFLQGILDDILKDTEGYASQHYYGAIKYRVIDGSLAKKYTKKVKTASEDDDDGEYDE